MLMFGIDKVREEEYIILKAQREEIKRQIDNLTAKLWETDMRFSFLEALFDPKINIIEVNNESMGHRYIGRMRVKDGLTGKLHILTVSIANAAKYSGKNDPELVKIAKEKAVELLKKKFPDVFL